MKIEDKNSSSLRLAWSEPNKRTTPDWQEKLRRIRQQLWQGSYSVKSEDVAKAILRKEKAFFGTKQPIPLRWWRTGRTPPPCFWCREPEET